MSPVKRLIIGIVLVAIGIVCLLSGSGFAPVAGMVLGITGLAITVFTLITGKF